MGDAPLVEIGAAWRKEGAKGEYFSASIGGVKVLLFPNTFKKAANQPDFRIMTDDPEWSAKYGREKPSQSQGQSQGQSQQQPSALGGMDEVPF